MRVSQKAITVGFLLALQLSIVSCGGTSSDIFDRSTMPPGVVRIDVLEGGDSPRYWQVDVQPSIQKIEVVRQERFPDFYHTNIPRKFLEPAGVAVCGETPHADSPDGQYVAACQENQNESLWVIDKSSGTKVFHLKRDQSVRGFAWASNSRSLVILAAPGTLEITPKELLSYLSGHPVIHKTVFLEFVDVPTGKIGRYTVMKDVSSAMVRILDWKY